MGVIEAETRRPRHESDAAHAVRAECKACLPPRRRRHRSGSIWPCQCTCSGVSVSLWTSTTTRLPSLKPQQRTRETDRCRAWSRRCVRREFNESRGDADRVVGLFGRRGCRSLRQERSAGYSRRCRGDFQQRAAIDRHGLHSYLSAAPIPEPIHQTTQCSCWRASKHYPATANPGSACAGIACKRGLASLANNSIVLMTSAWGRLPRKPVTSWMLPNPSSAWSAAICVATV